MLIHFGEKPGDHVENLLYMQIDSSGWPIRAPGSGHDSGVDDWWPGALHRCGLWTAKCEILESPDVGPSTGHAGIGVSVFSPLGGCIRGSLAPVDAQGL